MKGDMNIGAIDKRLPTIVQNGFNLFATNILEGITQLFAQQEQQKLATLYAIKVENVCLGLKYGIT